MSDLIRMGRGLQPIGYDDAILILEKIVNVMKCNVYITLHLLGVGICARDHAIGSKHGRAGAQSEEQTRRGESWTSRQERFAAAHRAAGPWGRCARRERAESELGEHLHPQQHLPSERRSSEQRRGSDSRPTQSKPELRGAANQ